MTLGSGTAASSLFAGAVFGYELLWVAPVGMLLGVLVMGVVSHQTLSTGRRVLPAMAEHASKPIAAGFAVAAMLASIIWHFAQYNLGASVIVDAAGVIGVDGLPPIVGSAIILVWAVALSLTYGKSSTFVRFYERFLKYTVWAIVLLLLWVVIHTDTDWGAVFAGFVPSIPEDVVVPGEKNPVSAIFVIVAGLAAAVGINMLLLYPYSLQARGWGREHRGLARFDLFTGMLIPYALASGLMVIASANTLGDRAVGHDASVGLLAGVLGDVIGPVAGRLLFDLGMLAMSLSTITLHMVCCGFVAMEWFGLPFGSSPATDDAAAGTGVRRAAAVLEVPGLAVDPDDDHLRRDGAGRLRRVLDAAAQQGLSRRRPTDGAQWLRRGGGPAARVGRDPGVARPRPRQAVR